MIKNNTINKNQRLAEAIERLNELLVAFGLARAQEQLPLIGSNEREGKHNRAMGSLASLSDADRIKQWHKELLGAYDVLNSVCAKVRKIRQGFACGEFIKPREYETSWRGIIDEWDKAVCHKRWLQLPPLCETCGTPVLLRKPARLKGGAVKLRV